MSAPFLTALLSLFALLLGLSVLVQTLQEIYKYLTNNKNRAYANSMRDYMGALFSQLLNSPVVQDLRVRGPFQVVRFRPKQHILPLNGQQLEAALLTTLSPWKRRLNDALTREVTMQNGNPAVPSPDWNTFLAELSRIVPGSSDAFSSDDVVAFLHDWGHTVTMETSTDGFAASAPVLAFAGEEFDARKILASYSSRFLNRVQHYVDNYPAFNEAFDFQYKRRNARISFVIAMLLALCANLPIQQVYKTSRTMDDKSAMELLQNAAAVQRTLDTMETQDMRQARTAPPPTAMIALPNDTVRVFEQAPKKAIDTARRNRVDTLVAMSYDLVASVKNAQHDSTGLFNVNEARRQLGALFCWGSRKSTTGGVSSARNCPPCDTCRDDCRPAEQPPPATWRTALVYILGCFATALALSFGAPIINDAAGALLRITKGQIIPTGGANGNA